MERAKKCPVCGGKGFYVKSFPRNAESLSHTFQCEVCFTRWTETEHNAEAKIDALYKKELQEYEEFKSKRNRL